MRTSTIPLLLSTIIATTFAAALPASGAPYIPPAPGFYLSAEVAFNRAAAIAYYWLLVAPGDDRQAGILCSAALGADRPGEQALNCSSSGGGGTDGTDWNVRVQQSTDPDCGRNPLLCGPNFLLGYKDTTGRENFEQFKPLNSSAAQDAGKKWRYADENGGLVIENLAVPKGP